MRSSFVWLLFLLASQVNLAQHTITGKIISSESQQPLPFAKVILSQDISTLTNIKGEFNLENTTPSTFFTISYPGHVPLKVFIIPTTTYYFIELSVQGRQQNYEKGPKVNEIIRKAIGRKKQNDPELSLEGYSYQSYNKLMVEKQQPSNLPKGRNFLSEKVSKHFFEGPSIKKEVVTGINTVGFKDPVYEILTINTEPHSLYKDDYPIYGTRYAGPLGKKAFRNYTFKILDTVSTSGRPGYMIYFKPKRPKVVAGWEGILFLDTVSLAIQKSTTQLAGPIEIEINEDYGYFEEKDIWFPLKQQVTLKPGTGGMDISIFGGSISLGTVQRKSSILNTVLSPGLIENDLALISVTNNYSISFNVEMDFEKKSAAILVLDEAPNQPDHFWEINRQQAYTLEDELTAERVQTAIQEGDILRKREVLNAISQGFYPVGFFDFDLSNFVKYNKYEGFRMGAGGKTNEKFSQRLRLEGLLVYGFKDEAFKYGLGGGILLNQRSGTWWNLNYVQDIREVASHDYLRGVNDFSILEPRSANISYYYAFNSIQTSLEHRFSPRLDSELQFSQSDISQLQDYAFFSDDKLYRDYTITAATLGFLWRPFSKFLSTPYFHEIYDKRYPVITGQISQGFTGVLNGNFNFTKLGLKMEYEYTRQDRSITQITLEGNYGIGEIPLTHAFHAFPNNPNKSELLERFSVAGKISFETMYFNEFFSDRQAAVYIRHQLRPFRITDNIQPEFALISRHVIGNFNNFHAHRNIEFNTLEHVYSEAGLELNQIFLGFGISTAYRYGAYHLPSFKDNFSLKFTFNLKI